MSQEELMGIYFGFYDQLLDPYAKLAKESWNYKFCKTHEAPKYLKDAIMTGFIFRNNLSVDWGNVWESIDVGETTYLKPIEKEAVSEEQIRSYLVYLAVEIMGEESLTKAEIISRADKMFKLLQ